MAMEFSVDKCRALHKRKKGCYFRHEMAGSDVVFTSQERESWGYENGLMETSAW